MVSDGLGASTTLGGLKDVLDETVEPFINFVSDGTTRGGITNKLIVDGMMRKFVMDDATSKFFAE